MKLRISHKLIAGFIGCGVTPLVAAAVVADRASVGVEDGFASQMKSTAFTLADKADRNLFERYGDAQAFTTNHAVRDAASWYKQNESDNHIIKAMNQYVDLYDTYYLTIMVDKTGRVVAVNSKDSDGRPIDTKAIYAKNFKDAPWFAAVSKGSFTTTQPHAAPGNDALTGTFVEDVVVDEDVKGVYGATSGTTIGLSAVVHGEKGEVVGYWTNRMKFSVIEGIAADFYREQKDTGRPGTSILVLDGKGRTILDYDPSRTGATVGGGGGELAQLFRVPDPEDPAVKAVLGGAAGYGRGLDRTGRPSIFGYTRDRGSLGFAGMGWSVVARAPREEVMPALVAQQRTLWALYPVAFLLVGALGIALARRTARPLVEMASVADAIARGDTTRRVAHRGTDEIGVLADSLRGVAEFVDGVAHAAEGLARGDLDVTVEKRSEADVLSQSLLNAKAALRRLTEQVDALSLAAQEGRLDARGQVRDLDGVYVRLVEGLNSTMVAFGAPVAELKGVLAAMAQRDLSARMTGDYGGDYAAVKEALNQALANIEATLEGVVSSAHQVATASTEISSGTQSLSQAATEQASSLEEVTSSLQEITAMSKQNAGNAQQARAMAQSASDGAEQGVRSMSKLSEAVVSIKGHADQTAKIVKTIDEIAFQTNLLALNAAVEAARAGDAGKGFAVVAEEVRSLAMRSAEAAKNTSRLIEESVRSAELGVRLNVEASGHFNDITDQVRKVVEVMGEIAAASEQQSRGVAQINSAVDEMSRVTQHNAATTEQSAAAAEELSAQASSVQQMVNAFRLSGQPSAKPTLRPVATIGSRFGKPASKSTPKRASMTPPPLAATGTGDVRALFPLDDDEGRSSLEEF